MIRFHKTHQIAIIVALHIARRTRIRVRLHHRAIRVREDVAFLEEGAGVEAAVFFAGLAEDEPAVVAGGGFEVDWSTHCEVSYGL